MSVLHALVTRTSSCAALVAAVTLGAQQPTPPKVPFGNSPCAPIFPARSPVARIIAKKL